MTITRKLSIPLTALLAITACDVSGPPSIDAADDAAETHVRAAPPVVDIIADHCPTKRQLATLAANVDQCPSVAGWTGTRVFPNANGALRKFCKYDWAGGVNTLPDLGALQAAAGLSGVDSDCGGVFGNTTTDAVWAAVGDEVEQAFHAGIGLPSAADLKLPTTEADRHPVFVAVIDTVPEPRPADPRSPHGEFMVSLVNDVACPHELLGSCAVQTKRVLGLPRYVENGESDLIDTVRGGHYGTQRDMAQAIYQAVSEWRALYGDDPNPPKLILNLSIGWERENFGDDGGLAPRPAVVAVRAAIEYARCQGALIIASAGNRGYSCGVGPVAPAAWETEAAPGPNRCAALNVQDPLVESGYAPLIYSVGGLTHDHEPMLRSRPDGKPRLAALATNAVTGNAGKTVTGTSVAAAVTSGTAALVWSYNPDLTPAEVMDIIYEAATPTGLESNYHLAGAAATDVRAVNACAALEAACNRPEASCPADPFDSPLACLGQVQAATLDQLFSYLDSSTDAVVSPSVVGDSTECENECGTTSQAYVTDEQTSACPVPSSMTRPYTLPQPTQIGCPNCSLDLVNNVVYASLDPELASSDTVEDVTVSVFDGETSKSTYFRFGFVDLKPDALTKIVLDEGKMPAYVRSASITITFEGKGPVIDPLLLGP